jgi:hypothetical protein
LLTGFYTSILESKGEANAYLRVKREERLAVEALNHAINKTTNSPGLSGTTQAKNLAEMSYTYANDPAVKAFEGAKAENDRLRAGGVATGIADAILEQRMAAFRADPNNIKTIEKREKMQALEERFRLFSHRRISPDGTENASEFDKSLKMMRERFGDAFSDEDLKTALSKATMGAKQADLADAIRHNTEFSLKKAEDVGTATSAVEASDVVAEAIRLLALTLTGQEADAKKAGLTNPVKRPGMNVTINRIQVESADPERFVYGMEEAFADAVRNPSQARQIVKSIKG